MKDILERKIKYNLDVVDYRCKVLESQDRSAKLFHIIETPFTMVSEKDEITIPKGSYTLAYYWEARPYNVYFWRSRSGEFLGAYFNLVKNTKITSEMVSFEDLILDVLVYPDGRYAILDEDELPTSIELFENGTVKESLHALITEMDDIMEEVKQEAAGQYSHEALSPYLA
ncbi:DUF402 domain-containing protein [Rossellomorea aquimaris]|uniref:DUF402 domain-containing protein n=1 Tax=Rossellomorea aquimaris TaxID=189382 RepID=UPI001CD4EC67|nr:DUF402 domain-containing protein [Rossellomorea aquimaris]MCA1060332.1 DUF402 domain-containing protein [Rossellomorea aquimaris]